MCAIFFPSYWTNLFSNMQELLDHATYIEEEREYLGEQLSEMEQEVLKERRERELLQKRLQSLQQKVLICQTDYLTH